MADEIRAFACLIPAGTPIAAPVVIPMVFPPRTVDSIEIRIPPGPNGTVGFAIAAAGQPIIPLNAGQWIIANNDTISWPLSGFLNSGAWQLRAYNAGIYPHTLYVRFLLTQIGVTAPGALAPIPPGLIELPPGGGDDGGEAPPDAGPPPDAGVPPPPTYAFGPTRPPSLPRPTGPFNPPPIAPSPRPALPPAPTGPFQPTGPIR